MSRPSFDVAMQPTQPVPRSRRDMRTPTGRVAAELRRKVGLDLRRIRIDAGLSIRAVAAAARIDPSHLSLIERGLREPSLAVLAALANVLGLDISLRLYPTTGPTIRDRLQAAIVEMLIRSVGPEWRRLVEVRVRHPARGVIDLVLAKEIIVATEIHSELRGVEQLIRWAGDKADSLPSADAWQMLSGGEPRRVERLLVIRSTRANRDVVRAHAATFATAYPGDPTAARQALTGSGPWPGSSILWARVDGGRAELLLRRPPGLDVATPIGQGIQAGPAMTHRRRIGAATPATNDRNRER
jgi:transcriptional regulator with XRE-family HTH domain